MERADLTFRPSNFLLVRKNDRGFWMLELSPSYDLLCNFVTISTQLLHELARTYYISSVYVSPVYIRVYYMLTRNVRDYELAKDKG